MKQMKEKKYSKEEKGMPAKGMKKMGSGLGSEENGPKGKKGIAGMENRMRDQDGKVGKSEPIAPHAPLGADHAYLGENKSHIKNGFKPVSAPLDAHDEERNPHKPKYGYEED